MTSTSKVVLESYSSGNVNTISLDTDRLSNGVYFYQVSDQQGNVLKTDKLIKM